MRPRLSSIFMDGRVEYKIEYYDKMIDAEGVRIGRYLAVRKTDYGYIVDHIPTGRRVSHIFDSEHTAFAYAEELAETVDLNIAPRKYETTWGHRVYRMEQDFRDGVYIGAGRHAGI